MENMGKHEYMESMNVKTRMFFRLGKKEGFHTHGQKKNTTDRPTLFIFLRYGKQTYFLCLTVKFRLYNSRWSRITS